MFFCCLIVKGQDTLNTKGAGVTDKQKPKTIPHGWIDKDGLIYSDLITKPPVFGDGYGALYSYLENNVKVMYEVDKVYGKKSYTFLVRVKIDNTGKILSAEETKRGTIFKLIANEDKARRLETGILTTIGNMPSWSPGMIKDNYKGMTFYLPLKFVVEQNVIRLEPSRYVFPFNNIK